MLEIMFHFVSRIKSFGTTGNRPVLWYYGEFLIYFRGEHDAAFARHGCESRKLPAKSNIRADYSAHETGLERRYKDALKKRAS